jgi:AraC family transcriptional regulator, transcriptional activator FtrA
LLLAEEFLRAYPRVRLEPEHLYVRDGPIFTSGGILSATDLSLHLIAADLGQAYANDVARVLVSAPYRPGGQAQFEKPALRSGAAQSNGAFLAWLRDHLHEPLSMADVAAYRHMSERTLIRTFRRETGMTVFAWITAERVSRAKDLLETTDRRIGEIAAMVGFGSYEAFRRAFESGAGVPAAYREMFRAASPRRRRPA